jgi:hypothetical protein
MPLLLLVLLFGTLLYMSLSRRNFTLTLTRTCRLDRTGGEDHHVCGAVADLPPGKTPRDCLRGSEG